MSLFGHNIIHKCIYMLQIFHLGKKHDGVCHFRKIIHDRVERCGLTQSRGTPEVSHILITVHTKLFHSSYTTEIQQQYNVVTFKQLFL